MKDFSHQFVRFCQRVLIHVRGETRAANGLLRQQVAVGVANIDADVHRQADAQRVFLHIMGIEYNTDRQTLDNFDPVAAGVLCRQQRERATGANAQAFDGAVILDIIAVTDRR